MIKSIKETFELKLKKYSFLSIFLILIFSNFSIADENSENFVMNVPNEFRSLSNIVFDFRDHDKTLKFLESSSEQGYLGLNGHRSIGGIRVSNYNSVTTEMMNDLITHLKGFI